MLCGKSQRSPDQALGMLYMVLGLALFANYSPAPYPARAADPGERTIYADNAGPRAIKNADKIFKLAKARYENAMNMNQSLNEEFILLIEDS